MDYSLLIITSNLMSSLCKRIFKGKFYLVKETIRIFSLENIWLIQWLIWELLQLKKKSFLPKIDQALSHIFPSYILFLLNVPWNISFHCWHLGLLGFKIGQYIVTKKSLNKAFQMEKGIWGYAFPWAQRMEPWRLAALELFH